MSLHRACCCGGECCTTTAFTLEVRPSLSYTIACGTNGRYMNTGLTYNLGANPPGYGIATRGISANPGQCYSECSWVTLPTEYKYSLVNVPTCNGFCQSWNYYTTWSLRIAQDDSGIWRGILGVAHRWYSTGTAGCAVAEFVVNAVFTRTLAGANPCPSGPYSFTSFTACNGVAVNAGSFQSTGVGLPLVTFNALTTNPVVA